MLDSLFSIGEWIYESQFGIESDKEFIDILLMRDEALLRNILSILKSEPSIKGRKEYFILIVNIDLDKYTHSFKIEEYYGEAPVDYAYIGHKKGNKPQDLLTVSSLKYIISLDKGLKAILKNIDSMPSDLKELFKGGPQPFYDVLRRLIEYYNINSKKIDEDLKNYLDKEGITNQIALYTVAVKQGDIYVVLSKTIEYYIYIIHNYFWPYGSKPISGSRCHICGSDKDVFPDPKFPEGSLLKIYTLDKIGFISGITKSLLYIRKNFSICYTCRVKILLGLKKVENDYTVEKRILGFPILTIPKIVGGHLKNYDALFNGVRETIDWKDLKKLINILNQLVEYADVPTYYIHLVFGETGKSDFKYYGSILDIPIVKIESIYKVTSNIVSEFEGIIPDIYENFMKGFPFIYLKNIIPIPTRDGGRTPILKDYISILSSIFKDEPVSLDHIYKLAKTYSKIYRFGVTSNTQFNLVDSFDRREKDFVYGLLKYNFLIYYFKRVGLIKGGFNMTSKYSGSFDMLPDSLRDYIKAIDLEEKYIGLFLLGYLVGVIGTEQYKRGDSKKSVLDKVKYNGMSREDVIRLSNYIVKGLRDYRRLEYNELIYQVAKEYLDKYIDKLFNIDENLYYILSGYAYSTYRSIVSGGGKNE